MREAGIQQSIKNATKFFFKDISVKKKNLNENLRFLLTFFKNQEHCCGAGPFLTSSGFFSPAPALAHI